MTISITRFFAGYMEPHGNDPDRNYVFAFAENPDGTGVGRIVGLDPEEPGAYSVSTEWGVSDDGCALRLVVSVSSRRLTLHVSPRCAERLGIPQAETFQIDDGVSYREILDFCEAVRDNTAGTDISVQTSDVPSDNAIHADEVEAPARRKPFTPPLPTTPTICIVEFGVSGRSTMEHLQQLEHQLREGALQDRIEVAIEVAGVYTEGQCVSVRFRPDDLSTLASEVTGWAVAHLGDGMLSINGMSSTGSTKVAGVRRPEKGVEYDIGLAVGLA